MHRDSLGCSGDLHLQVAKDNSSLLAVLDLSSAFDILYILYVLFGLYCICYFFIIKCNALGEKQGCSLN